MIRPNRELNINHSKESLLKEIDEEIQKEYQILNKFSSEKFSVFLVIFGVLSLIITIWPDISNFFNLTQMILFYILSATLLILIWTYWEIVKNIFKFILKIPIAQKPIILQKTFDIFLKFDINEREKLKILTSADWAFTKKGEPHSWAYLIFLLTLIGISYANIQGLISVSHLNDIIVLDISIAHTIIIFSFFMICANYYVNIRGDFYERLFEIFKIFSDESNSKIKTLIFAVLSIFGGLFILIYPILSYIFPLFLLYFFAIPNLISLTNNFLNNFLILIFFMIILNTLVEFLAVAFGINIIENVKNEKIWWLEKLKLEIYEISSKPSNDEPPLNYFYKKFDCADIFIPIPIQRFLIFQKYVVFPKWIFKPTIDLDSCDEEDFQIFKERFEFHKNLVYRNKEP